MINGFKIAALCVSKVHERYIGDFIREFNTALSPEGWRVLVYTVNSDLYRKTRSDKGEAYIFDLIDYERTEAVVVFPASIYDDAVKEGIVTKAREHGVRIIMVDNYSHEGCINMRFDYRSGFSQIVRHLFDVHGVRDIRMIAGNRNKSVSDERIEVVRELAAERGIEFGDDRIKYGDFWNNPAEQACEEIIAENSLPQAIICANDAMAIAVCGVLRKHGIRVPEDVTVTGFDGIEETRYTNPNISTVRCSFGKLGKASAQALLDPTAADRDIFIMPDLIVSESCGCTGEPESDVSELVTSYWNMFDRYRNDERKLAIISAKVQGCTDIDSAEEKLTDRVFFDLVCVLKKECNDPTYDPLVINTDTPFGKDMVVLLDTRESYIGRDRSMDISQIVPGLDSIFEKGIPLIFTALHYIDIPLGYVCFFYKDPGKAEYNKISQSTGCLSSAVSGYRSMRYQHRLREWIEEVYKYDELTGLYTRKSFVKEYELMLREEACKEMTLVLCDLDGLKYINDNFGHSEGDMAIRVVAKAMELACTGGICSKHGGDELLAAVPRICDAEKIKADIERFIEDYNEASMKPYKVSSSIGVFTAENCDLSFPKLFAQVDDLMYTDKMRKKNIRAAAVGNH